MDLDTVKYFHEKRQGISKIIDVAPKSLTPEQVMVGAQRVYDRIKKGEVIEDRDLDWAVLAEAKEVKAEAFLEEQEIFADVSEVIRRIRKEKDKEISVLKNTVYGVDKYYQDHLSTINLQLDKISKAIDKLKKKEDLNELWLHILENISPATD